MKTLVSVVAAFLLAIGIANAVDPPQMREGLWTMHKQMIDNPGNKKSESTNTLCRSRAYDQHTESLAKSMKGCTMSTKGEGGKYYSESHCVVAGTVVDSKGTATYQGDSAVHSESHATYNPPMAGLSDTTMIVDQKYVGACPAGQQPGDLTDADGNVVHLGKH